MFKVKIGEDEYEVTFFHSIPEPDDYKYLESEEFRVRFGTSCYVYLNGRLVKSSNADLSIKDNFNRNIGRKVSLAKALQYIEPNNRVLFWDAYYKARGNKW